MFSFATFKLDSAESDGISRRRRRQNTKWREVTVINVCLWSAFRGKNGPVTKVDCNSLASCLRVAFVVIRKVVVFLFFVFFKYSSRKLFSAFFVLLKQI